MATNKEVYVESSRKSYNNVDSIEQLMYVETGNNEFAGYSLELLVHSLSELEIDFYVCTECKGVMRNACQIGEEQIPVCEGCVKEGVPSQSMVKSRNKILELQAKCPLVTRGCNWNGKMAEVEEHLIICQTVVVNCENGCKVVLPRSELDNHVTLFCVKRQVMCEHCDVYFMYEQLTEHHGECLEYQIPCPNNCNVSVKRKLIGSHFELECPNMVVECPYKKFGCEREVLRCELEEHKKINQIQHLEYTSLFAISEIEQLKQTNIQLTETNIQQNATNIQLTETNIQQNATNKQLIGTNKQLTEANIQLTKANKQQNETNIQLTRGNKQQNETNIQLTKGNKQQNDTKIQLTESNKQLTKANKQQNETNIQLTEANKQLTKANKQQNETNIQLCGRVNILENQVEGLSYPIVLRGEVTEGIPYTVNWRNNTITVQFYCNQFNGFAVQVFVMNDYRKNPFSRWPFEGRFKLTMIDRTNECHIFESGVVKLQPPNVPRCRENNPHEYTIVSTLLKDSYHTNGKLNVILQIQDTKNQ